MLFLDYRKVNINEKYIQTTLIEVKFNGEFKSELRTGLLACKEKSENCKNLSKHEVEFIREKIEKVAHAKFPAVLYIALRKIQNNFKNKFM